MSMKTYVTVDSAGRSGRVFTCRDADAGLQALPAGHTYREATDADVAAVQAKAREAFDAALAAKPPPEDAVDPVDLMRAILELKGIAVTDADLTTAAATARARRGGPARSGQ